MKAALLALFLMKLLSFCFRTLSDIHLKLQFRAILFIIVESNSIVLVDNPQPEEQFIFKGNKCSNSCISEIPNIATPSIALVLCPCD